MKLATLVAAVAFLAAPLAANAAGLVDGSFEIKGGASPVTNYCYDGVSAGGNAACAAGAWTGNGIIASGNGAWGSTTASNGSYFAFIQGASTLEQTFTAATSGNQSLTWFDTNRTNNGGSNTYTVSISDGAKTQSLGVFTSAQGGFIARSALPFATVAGTSYKLSFTGTVAADATSFIDNVELSVVPEPATWSMLITGFAMSGVAMRRRKAVAA